MLHSKRKGILRVSIDRLSGDIGHGASHRQFQESADGGVYKPQPRAPELPSGYSARQKEITKH